jgi:hypothetical protein
MVGVAKRPRERSPARKYRSDSQLSRRCLANPALTCGRHGAVQPHGALVAHRRLRVPLLLGRHRRCRRLLLARLRDGALEFERVGGLPGGGACPSSKQSVSLSPRASSLSLSLLEQAVSLSLLEQAVSLSLLEQAVSLSLSSSKQSLSLSPRASSLSLSLSLLSRRVVRRWRTCSSATAAIAASTRGSWPLGAGGTSELTNPLLLLLLLLLLLPMPPRALLALTFPPLFLPLPALLPEPFSPEPNGPPVNVPCWTSPHATLAGVGLRASPNLSPELAS